MATNFDLYITNPDKLPELTEKFNHYGFLQEKIGLKGEETKENIFFGLIQYYINVYSKSKLSDKDKENIVQMYNY